MYGSFMGAPNMRPLGCDQLEIEVPDSELGGYAKAYHKNEVVTLPSGSYRVVGAAKLHRRRNSAEVYLHRCAPVFIQEEQPTTTYKS